MSWTFLPASTILTSACCFTCPLTLSLDCLIECSILLIFTLNWRKILILFYIPRWKPMAVSVFQISLSSFILFLLGHTKQVSKKENVTARWRDSPKAFVSAGRKAGKLEWRWLIWLWTHGCVFKRSLGCTGYLVGWNASDDQSSLFMCPSHLQMPSIDWLIDWSSHSSIHSHIRLIDWLIIIWCFCFGYLSSSFVYLTDWILQRIFEKSTRPLLVASQGIGWFLSEVGRNTCEKTDFGWQFMQKPRTFFRDFPIKNKRNVRLLHILVEKSIPWINSSNCWSA